MKDKRTEILSVGYHIRNGLKRGRQKEKEDVKQKDSKTKDIERKDQK
jgi:hypothetical protein